LREREILLGNSGEKLTTRNKEEKRKIESGDEIESADDEIWKMFKT
jgi:hypothetical protein